MTEQKMIDGDALLEWLREEWHTYNACLDTDGEREAISEVIEKIKQMKEEMRGQTTPC